MTVLVTGGTGFLGSHLAERYLDRKAPVVALGLTRRREEREEDMGEAVTPLAHSEIASETAGPFCRL